MEVIHETCPHGGQPDKQQGGQRWKERKKLDKKDCYFTWKVL